MTSPPKTAAEYDALIAELIKQRDAAEESEWAARSDRVKNYLLDAFCNGLITEENLLAHPDVAEMNSRGIREYRKARAKSELSFKRADSARGKRKKLDGELGIPDAFNLLLKAIADTWKALSSYDHRYTIPLPADVGVEAVGMTQSIFYGKVRSIMVGYLLAAGTKRIEADDIVKKTLSDQRLYSILAKSAGSSEDRARRRKGTD